MFSLPPGLVEVGEGVEVGVGGEVGEVLGVAERVELSMGAVHPVTANRTASDPEMRSFRRIDPDNGMPRRWGSPSCETYW